MKAKMDWNMRGWSELVSEIVDTEGVRRMQKVADACNQDDDTDGYMVSVEGGNPLYKRDYRATVITTTGAAIRGNAEHQTLVKNFYRASDGIT